MITCEKCSAHNYVNDGIVMKITREEVEKVARLARLDMSTAEAEQMTAQLDALLSYVTKLDELDTTDIKPMTHPMDVVNAFRKDEVSLSLTRPEALANAPQDDGETFTVPRVI